MPTTYRCHHASAISDPLHLNPWPLLRQTTGTKLLLFCSLESSQGTQERSFRPVYVKRHANPGCDCQHVHVEFWERSLQSLSKRKITLEQRLMVIVSLDGTLKETRFTEESASTTRYLVAAWLRRCRDQLALFRQRYKLIKTIGARSFPETSTKTTAVLRFGASTPETWSEPRVGRNAPCPCGSVRKFKRCCGQRIAK